MAWYQSFRNSGYKLFFSSSYTTGTTASSTFLPHIMIPLTMVLGYDSYTMNSSSSSSSFAAHESSSKGIEFITVGVSSSSSSKITVPYTSSNNSIVANPRMWVHDALEGDGKLIRKALGITNDQNNTEFKESLSRLVLFSGSSNPSLADEIAYELNQPLGKINRETFADGETSLQALESVRGKDVYLIQSTSPPVNENLLELCLMISLMRRASARSITALIPYYGYKRDVGTSGSFIHVIGNARDDNNLVGGAKEAAKSVPVLADYADDDEDSLLSISATGREDYTGESTSASINDNSSVYSSKKLSSVGDKFNNPSSLAAAAAALMAETNTSFPVAAADVARMLETVGVDRVLTIELQPPGMGHIEGFFSPTVPVESLRSTGIAVDYISRLNLHNPVVVAPNESCIQLAYDMRNGLQHRMQNSTVGIAAIMQSGPSRGSDRYAHRPRALMNGRTIKDDSMELVGDVRGKDVLICDDMIDTAKTLMTRIQLLKDRGAQRVVAFATHGLFTGGALQRITRSPLSDVVVTNTIPLREDVNTRHTHKIAQLSVAPLLAEAILRVQTGQSLQDLRIFDRDTAEPRYKGQE